MLAPATTASGTDLRHVESPLLSLGHERGGVPLLPAPAWLAGRGGRPARYCMRDIVDAIRYLTHNGPVWRALPADFPPPGPSTGGPANGKRTVRPRGCTMTCATGSARPRTST